uniref:Uncharacterized protein n=1 Tax=Candidatus Kentrum sp. LFY TaxID=2126342 RepID=A0A450VAE7_9GAMM|nr:MAG: hypothetical protein BECKLFY1418A_GA0070994_11591 [Candidatus Kentron sp. LFY]
MDRCAGCRAGPFFDIASRIDNDYLGPGYYAGMILRKIKVFMILRPWEPYPKTHEPEGWT